MAVEIERKFLVIGSDWKTPAPTLFRQGYLNRDKHRTVRVRVAGQNAWLTVKGQSVGPTRPEFEYPIPLDDANELLELCEQPLIEKYRHVQQLGKLQWEIDEFLGENAGLIVAEVELEHPEQAIDYPSWIDTEVTNEPKYFNSNLSENPFKNWER